MQESQGLFINKFSESTTFERGIIGHQAGGMGKSRLAKALNIKLKHFEQAMKYAAKTATSTN